MENIPNMEKMWFQLENHRTKSTKLCSCRTLCYQRVYHPSNQHPPCQLWGWKTIQLRTHPQKTLYHHRRISQIELKRVKMKQRTTYIHIIKYIIRYIYYNIIYIYIISNWDCHPRLGWTQLNTMTTVALAAPLPPPWMATTCKNPHVFHILLIYTWLIMTQLCTPCFGCNFNHQKQQFSADFGTFEAAVSISSSEVPSLGRGVG